MSELDLSVFRGDARGGEMVAYRVPRREGMVVLDAVLWAQAALAPDLAVRWNCKAAKCGSCAAEIDGHPRLMCKTSIESCGDAISVRPLRAVPVIRDLVTDVSWNYEVNRRVPPFTPSAVDADSPEPWRMRQEDVDLGPEALHVAFLDRGRARRPLEGPAGRAHEHARPVRHRTGPQRAVDGYADAAEKVTERGERPLRRVEPAVRLAARRCEARQRRAHRR